MYFGSGGLLVAIWALFVVVRDSLCVYNGELVGGNELHGVAFNADIEVRRPPHPFFCYCFFYSLVQFSSVWFLFLVCNAATQLATQLPRRCMQVVRSNKVARKRLTISNGTPAMDLGPMNINRRIHSHIVLK